MVTNGVGHSQQIDVGLAVHQHQTINQPGGLHYKQQDINLTLYPLKPELILQRITMYIIVFA